MTYHDSDPEVCKPSKWGNTWLPYYASPRPGEWGVVYAFNCGARPRLFSFIITFPMLDQAAAGISGYSARAGTGRGYYMETGKDMGVIQLAQGPGGAPQANWPPDIPQDNIATILEHITVKSPCRWVVKGVDGPESVVSQYVPTIPRRS